jgi:hypothetical protein
VSCGRDGDPGEIRLYSVDKTKLIVTLKGHTSRVNCFAFTPDGEFLLSGGEDGKCILWETTTYEEVGRLKGHKDAVVGLSIHPNGKTVVTSSWDKTTLLWDLKDQRKKAVLALDKEISGPLLHSPNGSLLAAGTGGRLRLWDLTKKKEIANFQAHKKGICSLRFTPDGAYLVSCSDDGFVTFWDTKSWEQQGLWNLGRDKPVSLGISPRGNLLAVGSWGGGIYLFNISKEARLMRSLKRDFLFSMVVYWGHDLPVMGVAFAPDGKSLASGSLDSKVKTWIDLPSTD